MENSLAISVSSAIFATEMHILSLNRFLFIVILFIISMIDWMDKKIPDELLMYMAISSLPYVYLHKEVIMQERIIGIFIISVPMLVITLVRAGAFGGGDIKLMAVMGWILGDDNCVIAAIIGLFLSALYIIYAIRIGRCGRRSECAIGPFLCIGCFLALLYGEKISAWYLGTM